VRTDTGDEAAPDGISAACEVRRAAHKALDARRAAGGREGRDGAGCACVGVQTDDGAATVLCWHGQSHIPLFVHYKNEMDKARTKSGDTTVKSRKRTQAAQRALPEAAGVAEKLRRPANKARAARRGAGRAVNKGARGAHGRRVGVQANDRASAVARWLA
jgi:hypothetical protein